MTGCDYCGSMTFSPRGRCRGCGAVQAHEAAPVRVGGALAAFNDFIERTGPTYPSSVDTWNRLVQHSQGRLGIIFPHHDEVTA